MKIYLYILLSMIFLGCHSTNIPFVFHPNTLKNLIFYNTQHQKFTINTFHTEKNHYFLLVESRGGTSALEEPCGKITKMSFPEEAKYCFQMETVLSVLVPHNNLTIIEALKYPSKLYYSPYMTTTKVANKLREGYQGFRVTLFTSEGIILKQSHHVIWPNEIYALVK